MPSDGPDPMVTQTDDVSDSPTPAAVEGIGPPVRSGGARREEERARRRRLVVLVLLILLLMILSYVTYYYNMNRRLPVPRIVTAEQLQAPQFLYAFSGAGTRVMTRPTGIAMIGDRVYITDQNTRSVRVYSRPGIYQFEFSAVSDGTTKRLAGPVHIAVGPGDTLWVTDRLLKQLYVFDRDGKFLRVVHPNNDPGYQWSPLAITLDTSGTAYVSDVGDSLKHRVLVLAPDGTVKASWGGTKQITRLNEAPGEFYYPNGIAVHVVGKDTEVFVADGNNRRVQVFTPAGTFLRFINTSGTPRGVWIDREDRLYVADALAHRVDLYTAKGSPLIGFGENGIGPGQFSFPNDLLVDPSNGRIFVTDRENNQVQVWGFAAAEIPGITQISPSNWWVCLLPWPLFLLPLLFRRRRFVATPGFIDGMIDAGLVTEMQRGRWRWIVMDQDYPQYEGRVIDGVSLGELLHPEPYSASDAQRLADRLSIEMDVAGLLAMAQRYRILCTEDLDLARLAGALKVDAYDREAWLQRFAKRSGTSSE